MARNLGGFCDAVNRRMGWTIVKRYLETTSVKEIKISVIRLFFVWLCSDGEIWYAEIYSDPGFED